MEQRYFNQHGVGIYTVLPGGYSQQRKVKIPDLTEHKTSLLKRELQTITFYCMAHKKEEGTYHCNEKCLDPSAPGKACLSS